MEKQGLETILVVDDSYADRALLGRIFAGFYRVLFAESGNAALETLRREKLVSAVVLDLFMPGLDGFGVLAEIQKDDTLRNIPVVVITADDDDESQIKALDMGARDVIIKPFSPKPVFARVRNIAALQRSHTLDVEHNILKTMLEQREKQVRMLELDSMTGLYNRGAFINKAAEMINKADSGSYVLVCMDVDNFKVINDQYGVVVGDKVLKHIAVKIDEFTNKYGGIASRTSADNYAVLAPSDAAFILTNVSESLSETFRSCGIHINAHISTGCYYIDGDSLSVSVMLDRALMAKRSAKGRYDVSAVFFTAAMRESLLEKQWIISKMEIALKEKQFEVWYQPQYDHTVGQMTGAEALSRWRHPEKGLISPGLFIPLFEGNGFIYALDQYVWEQVCMKLRQWLNEGLDPLPVSVNVSRFDLLEPKFCSFITGLVEKYAIPKELFRLEITESALAKSAEQVINVVQTLSRSGFIIEIDDFGSGYSSFNTLKNVPADILKLDMQFFSGGDTERGGSIIESIVRMAKWLNMPVIAEGVEQSRQADFLCSIGCPRIQGYLYSRPIPASEYEKLLSGSRNRRFPQKIDGFGLKNGNVFWNLDSIETLIFNRFSGSACIFEYDGSSIELLRANDSFAAAFNTAKTTEELLAVDPFSVFDARSVERIRAALDKAVQSGDAERGEAAFCGQHSTRTLGRICFCIRLITQNSGHYLFHCYVESLTALRSAEKKLECGAEQLQTLLECMQQGAAAFKMENGGASLVFANDIFFELIGCTREQFNTEVPDFFALAHPDDRGELIRLSLESIENKNKPFSHEYRIIRRDGSTIRLSCRGRAVAFDGIEQSVQLVVYSDVSYRADFAPRSEHMDELPCGAGVFRFEDGVIKAEYMNRQLWNAFGVSGRPADFDESNIEKYIYSEDAAALKQLFTQKYSSSQSVMFSTGVHIRLSGGSKRFYVACSLTPERLVYALFMPHCIKRMKDSQPVLDASAYEKMLLDFITRDIHGGALCVELKTGFPIAYVSPALALWLGYESESELRESCGGQFINIIAPEDAEASFESITNQLREKDAYCTECRLLKKDGGFIWVREHGTLFTREGGGEILIGVCTDYTQAKELEEVLRLREQNASYRERLANMALENTNASVWEYDFNEKCIIQRLNSVEMHGFETIVPNVPDSLVESGFVHPDSAQAFLDMYSKLAAGSPFEHGVFRVQTSDRTGYWYEHIRYSSTFDENGKPLRAVGMSDDVTSEMMAVERYKHELEIKHILTPDIIFSAALNITQQKLDEFHTDTARGFTFPESITFGNAMDICAAFSNGDESIAYLCALHREQLELIYRYGERKIRREFLHTGAAGYIWLRLEINLVKNPTSEDLYSFVLVRDIDDDRRERDRLATLAQHDSLTGLLNHGSTHAAIKQRLRGSTAGGLCALMIIDIDDFKQVNDTYGHKVGDDVIVETGARICRVFENDVAGRVGGDEFMVLVMNVPDVNVVYGKVQRLLEQLSENVTSFNKSINIKCSIGVALCSRARKDFDMLYKAADSALYSVKSANKGSFMIVDV